MFKKAFKNTFKLEPCVILIAIIALMLVINNSVVASTPRDGELKKISPCDPYVAPHENIDLMKEAMLFELYSRITLELDPMLL
jgi:hypothetical protein